MPAQSVKNTTDIKNKNKLNMFKQTVLLTVDFEAAWRLMGPGSRTGTNDGGGSICRVSGITAIC